MKSSPINESDPLPIFSTEMDRYKEITASMRLFGDMRIKHLTLYIAFLAVVGTISAGLVVAKAHEPKLDFGDLNPKTLVPCFVMLITSLFWIMDVRASKHYWAMADTIPRATTDPDDWQSLLWPRWRHSNKLISITNSTNAIIVFFAVVYVFALWLAVEWSLPFPWQVAFLSLGVWVLFVTWVEYETYEVVKAVFSGRGVFAKITGVGALTLAGFTFLFWLICSANLKDLEWLVGFGTVVFAFFVFTLLNHFADKHQNDTNDHSPSG